MYNILKNLNNEKNYQLVQNIIEDGSIKKKDLPLFYELFWEEKYAEFNDIKTKLFFSIKKNLHLFDKQLFYESFGVNLENLKPFEHFKIRYFPISNNEYSALNKLYLFEHDIPEFPSTFPNTDKRVKESIEKLKQILGKNFFVCFDKHFCGDSFELALVAAFIVKDEYADMYSFTGRINSDGTISMVDFIEKKDSRSEKSGKFLVSPKVIDNISELSFLNTDRLYLPFISIFGKSSVDLQKNFKELSNYTSPQKLLSILKVKESDCSVFSENFLNNNIEEWKPFFEEAFDKIDKLKKYYSKVIIHYLLGVSAFAFPLGLKQTALNSCVIHHFQGDKIYKVLDFTEKDPRKIKKKVEKYNLIQSEYIENSSDELCIAIYLASHNPKKDAEYFAINTLKVNFLYIFASHSQGLLDPEEPEQWIDIVREIYSKIDETANNSKIPIKHYHFIFSTPVPIAFAIGMAIGDYKRLSVYNFDKVSGYYKKVFTKIG